jgi:hypothetical protein
MVICAMWESKSDAWLMEQFDPEAPASARR